MADVHDRDTRSYNMSMIKAKDTKPEILVRKYLHSKGFRFRLHVKDLRGKPDIVLNKYKTVIFISGCFWHGHVGCKYFVIPKTRVEWWTDKINKTKANDRRNNKLLQSLGWNVLTIFECELNIKRREETFERLLNELEKKNTGN